MKLHLAIGFLALAATSFGDSIVQNGNFATGDLTGWTTASVNYQWTVYPASEANGGAPASFFAGEGCQGDGCINGGTPNFLFQNLVTNPGDTYTLTFDYNPDSYAESSGPAELLAQWGGTDVIDLVFGITPEGTQTTSSAGFNTYVVTGLVASSASTELNFLGREDPSYDGLTNISVVDTSTSSAPEPSSWLLGAAGFLALGVAKVRGRRA